MLVFLGVSCGHGLAFEGLHQGMEVGRIPYKWPLQQPRAGVGWTPARLHLCGKSLAYLAREHTADTHAELAESLGVFRPGTVPNPTRRLLRWLPRRPEVREHLQELEEQLRRRQAAPPEKTANLV